MTDTPISLPKTPSAEDYARTSERPRIPETESPYDLLRDWLQEAEQSEPNDSTAMSLATLDASGVPDVRIVLMRGLSEEEGFKFYTNYDSAKGVQLEAHPHAALCFHWKSLRRQVRVRGKIRKLSAQQSDAYFQQRAAQSRIAAIASDQSRPLLSRDVFDQRIAEISAIYGDDDDIPRPPHWGGYALKPDEIEFWQDQQYRMHDRLKFFWTAETWTAQRLYP